LEEGVYKNSDYSIENVGFPNNNPPFTDIWGQGSNSVYVTSSGRRGRLLHFNGKRWKIVDIGSDEDLLSIWGTESDFIFLEQMEPSFTIIVEN
jgi:hypothetical protein